MKASRWLQRDLLRRLMLPVLGIVLLTGAATAYNAHSLIERVFDRWLLDAARALAEQVAFRDGQAVVVLSAQSEAILTYDIVDRVTYQVRQGDRHVLGQQGLAARGDDERQYSAGARAFNGVFDGRPVRIAWVPVRGPAGELAEVEVAETLAKREGASKALMVVFAPVAVLVLLAAAAVGIAVRRTVQPLEKMAAQWNERSHASLLPMPTEEVPRELLPFALALNDLLTRVRELVLRERHFASTAAHQLRTPLAGLQLAIARAAQCPDLQSTRAALAGLEASTQRTARLVQQLLLLARLDPEGRGQVELEEVDLVALAREVGEAYMDAAIAKDIQLELGSVRDEVIVPGQADLLREALGNLIDNAIRYTPPGGRIEMAVDAQPPSITVADSGAGIRQEDAAKVFERFVRGHGTGSEGTGLGLAIVKEIAALHHAEVLLESPMGEGARFVLRFAANSARTADTADRSKAAALGD